MVPFSHDPDPFYDRLVIPPQLAPRFVAESMVRLAKWQSKKMRTDDHDFLLVQGVVNELLLPWELEAALHECSAPVAQLVDEPKEKQHLIIQVGLDLDDRFCAIETFQPRARIKEVVTMRRNDPRIQSRTSGGH